MDEPGDNDNAERRFSTVLQQAATRRRIRDKFFWVQQPGAALECKSICTSLAGPGNLG